MIKCKCGKMAVWHYTPSDRADNDRNYCDNCVSRGCSCNLYPKEGVDLDAEYNSDDWYEPVDDQGRLFPCCEYDYDANGFREEDYD